MVEAVAWNMAFGIGARGLQLIGTLVLTHFIAPDDYGAVLAASITVLTAGVLTSFAFGQYLIARRAPADVAFQAAVLHLGLGVGAMAALVALRAPIGDLLDTPALGTFVGWYALAHLLDRAHYVPERLLVRELRFRTIAAIRGSGELAFSAVAVALAPRHGVYAVVIAVQVRAVLVTGGFIALAPRAQWLVRTPLRLDVVRRLFGYGLPIMLGAVADRAASRWDSLVVSRLFGPGVMGHYNLAYSLAELPVSQVADHIGEVLMPSFARMEDEPRRRAVVRSATIMALVVSPLGVGLGAVAPEVVAAFLDERWAGLGPMLAILGVMTVFRPMTWPAMAYLQAVSLTRLIMIASVARAALVLGLVAVLGSIAGPLGACVGACVGYGAHGLGTIVVTGRATGLPTGAYLIGVVRPLLACVPMFAAVTGVGRGLAALDVPVGVALVAEVATGAVVYAVSALVLVGDTVQELLRLVVGVLRRRAAAPERVPVPVAVPVPGPAERRSP